MEALSGGMRRKVEIAKGLLSNPKIIMMDEPSTGLDPGARKNLWELITRLNREENITFVLTTHLMDEAEHCHKVGILDEGELVTYGTPSELKAEVGGELVEIQTDEPDAICELLSDNHNIDANILDDALYFEELNGHNLIPELMEELQGRFQGISVRQPTLDDVFVHFTGHRFEESGEAGSN
ncbi:MAG: Daunorubicin/doxorubicin resistance ATP-binding protein DrrA [Candidatus Marinimicrobia bacterium]|nr:Daunorubicin/doxorubicin resistance ATP-binding protein DrrA [Candidatus Neomarinimicrobiota bacterium]